jgi:DNA-binding NarL/FixJ family response regulator
VDGCKFVRPLPSGDEIPLFVCRLVEELLPNRRELDVSNSSGRKVTVLVADDHTMIRGFLTTLLKQSGMQVVGEATNGHEAVRLCEQLRPHIILLDISMPLLNGLEAARHITKRVPSTKIIFVTGHTGQVIVDEALRVGGVGFVCKRNAAHDLLAAIEAVGKGETYVSGCGSARSHSFVRPWRNA